MKPEVYGLVGLIIVLHGAAFVARGFVPQPSEYARDFVATGLIEEVRPVWGGRCTVKLAVYAWESLGPGITLADAPQEGERYTVRARGETCDAVTVAAASGGHLEFSAGSPNMKQERWYFTERPSPAMGCLAPLDWQPPPDPA